MADGSLVVVEKGKPLPPAVIADVAAPAQVAQDAVPAASHIDTTNGQAIPNDVIAMVANGQVRQVFTKTGGNAIVVYRQYLALGAEGLTYQWVWTSTTSVGNALDKDGKVAEANAYVAAQKTPADWTVIVLN